MNKRGRQVLFLSLVLFGLVSFVFLPLISYGASAQVDAGGLKDTAENISGQVEKTREIIEGEKLDYLGERWKELLLQSSTVSRFDKLLTAMNPLFVILMAREYSFSLGMLFAFMFWLFTFLLIYEYTIFLEKDSYRWIVTIAGTIILAHLQIYNYFTAGLMKILLYQSGLGWKIASSIFIILIFFVYYFINKYFANLIKKSKEVNKQKGMENRVKRIEEYQEGFREGANA